MDPRYSTYGQNQNAYAQSAHGQNAYGYQYQGNNAAAMQNPYGPGAPLNAP